jgi:hypothetical protein
LIRNTETSSPPVVIFSSKLALFLYSPSICHIFITRAPLQDIRQSFLYVIKHRLLPLTSRMFGVFHLNISICLATGLPKRSEYS